MMTKISQSEVVEKVASRMNLTGPYVDRIVREVIGVIYEEVAKGNTVGFSGFGAFSYTERASRLGINPQTLKSKTIPALRVAKFKAKKKFKRIVNK